MGQVTKLPTLAPIALTYTVATLPDPTVVNQRVFVSDALAPVSIATVVAGGAIRVPVYSDGVNWKVG